mmetsp:Transcript_77314/g.217005  ORF Transcript_77314/g.217005 Transcript_77314/m.217005 type:complete len:208 (-) Transcript_77314:702-1325(-)
MLLIQALTARLTAIAQVVLAKVSSRCTLPLGQGIWMETSKSPRTRSSMCCTRAAELDSSKRQLGGTRPSGLRSVPCTFLPRRNHHSNRCSRKMRSKFISSLGLKAHLQSAPSNKESPCRLFMSILSSWCQLLHTAVAPLLSEVHGGNHHHFISVMHVRGTIVHYKVFVELVVLLHAMAQSSSSRDLAIFHCSAHADRQVNSRFLAGA